MYVHSVSEVRYTLFCRMISFREIMIFFLFNLEFCLIREGSSSVPGGLTWQMTGQERRDGFIYGTPDTQGLLSGKNLAVK